MKKLIIYIPSYNRADRLMSQLKVINKEMTSDIKVVISDNNSTDIEGYKNIEKYCTDNNLTYNRNATNLFSDTNIVSGFLHADKCNYLWILSDDDMLMEGSISTIMDILNHDIDVLFFTVKDRENIEFQSWNQKEFFKSALEIPDGPGLISYVIYKTDFIKTSVPVGFQHIYTCFAHLAILIDSFNNKEVKICRISKKKIFSSQIAIPAAMQEWYSKSYFGYVLLAELFKEDVKKLFLNDWTNIVNLILWPIKSKDKISKVNRIYADGYIKNNIRFYGMFKFKLLVCKVFLSPITIFIKKFLPKIYSSIRSLVKYG
jgi:glycosyltransferase involved in cell wall biosynthesis